MENEIPQLCTHDKSSSRHWFVCPRLPILFLWSRLTESSIRLRSKTSLIHINKCNSNVISFLHIN